MKIMIAGGGTGGHIYPGLAVARRLEEKYNDVEVSFVGTKDGLEADIIPKAGYELKTIKAEGFSRQISLQLIKAVAKTGVGLVQSFKLVKDFGPDLVLGTGGYVCGPLVLAAALQNIPTVIHEQNAYPGLTNRLLAKVVEKIALSNPAAREYFKEENKIEVTGNPIRPEILAKGESTAYQELELNKNKKTILVFGGSRGAKSINDALIGCYQKLRKLDVHVIHITGKKDFERVATKAKEVGINNFASGKIRIKDYLYNMEAALTIADLVVSRAGATGLAEITASGLAAILVPYPYATDNHQEYNARSLEENGAAKVILDQDLTANSLVSVIEELLTDEQQLEQMRKASLAAGEPQATDNLIAAMMAVKNK
jgi:UDP-N-acetylglucosamine--N-acetylmuramyl-(pentapeptide) pyrophosphoryl-undecaprenol N-acetylglucosamine transferase